MKNGSSYFFVVLVVCAKLVNTSCPSTCSCSNLTSGFYVNCNYKFLERIPDLPNDTYNLNFAYNSIRDIDVQLCKEMPLLQNIYINNNLIEKIMNDTFTDCHQLITLYLHNNRITDIHRDTFSNLAQLHTLHLYNNKIQSIESNTFVNMTNLYYLYLYNNEISTIEQSAFMNLPSLQYLHLYSNEISTIYQSAFMNLPSLRYLYLYNNRLRSIKSNTFVNMKSLYYLYLYYNKIQSIESNTFVNMTSLDRLFLYSNEISTIEQKAFMNLPSLQYLYIYNNKLTTIVENTFVNLSSLYYLHLGGNNISLIEENALGNLSQLSTLNLASNPINCDCSVIPFWSWIIERAFLGTSAKCSDGKFVLSVRSAELDKCNPDNCQCFNGGKCITSNDGKVVCDCIGQWTGELCLESQCMTYDCGLGNCFVEPMNGTAQCVCDNNQQTYCPQKNGPELICSAEDKDMKNDDWKSN